MTQPNSQPLLQRYAAILETLTPESVDEMLSLVSDDLEFKDPFNHTRGKAAYRAVMQDMFNNLSHIQFTVTRVDACPEGGYLSWQFSAYSKITQEIRAEGISRIHLDAQGLIVQHIDYWDGSRIMDGVPVLGRIIKAVRARAKCSETR